ncbi:MAG: phosphate ABC transporter substrate-binding/OmpA family protein [Paracoccaceae bacterium]
MINKAIFKRSSAFCALAVAGALTAPTASFAAEVTLKSSDGTVNIVGELQGFEENSYVVKTGLGELRISAERVRCEGEACPVFETASADVVIAGSDTVGLGMMPLLLEGFAGFLDAESTVTATSQEGELIAEMIGDQGFGDPLGSYLVSSTASGDAFTKLLSKDTEIGMASRRIRPAEARALRDAGAGNMVSPDQEHIIAVDSLVVITHPENPIQTLSMEQLGAIYSGNITNWSQLGGPDLKINVIGRQQESGTSAVFYSRILGDTGELTLSSDITIAENNNEAAALVNNDPSAIGFVGYAFQRGAKALSLVNECGITMRPDAFSARTEEYALQRRLYLYNRADNLSEASEDFLEYAISESADGVIAKSGFIGLEIDQRPMTADSDRARDLAKQSVDAFEAAVASEMLEMMVDYDRLSTTFRFRTGSSQLDERGVKDMQRLTAYLENAPAGTKVMVVGFTDSVGAFASNRGLSERRAEQVLADLRNFGGGRLDGIEMASAGFGEVSPSACNVSEDGRRINRRVEIWVTNQAG